MGACCGADSELPDRDITTPLNKVKEPIIVKVDIDTDYEVPPIFTEKQLKWSTESNRCNDKQREYIIQCNHLHSDCINIQRLFFVLLESQKRKDSNDMNTFSAKSLINNNFKDYSDVDLINDYIHFLQHHVKDKISIKMIKELFDIKQIDCNDPNQCVATNRILSDIVSSLESKSDSDISDVEEIASLHFIDMIHCNLFHSAYFENIFCSKSNDKFKTNGDCGIKTKNTKSSSSGGDNFYFGEAMKFYAFAPRFEYEEPSPLTNLYASSSLYSSSYSSNPSYSSSYQYALREKKILLVSKKYNDLKEEILNNKWGNLTISEWDFIAHKASIYTESSYIKKNVTTNSSVQHHQYKEYRFSYHLDLNQVICLLLLCDFKNIANSLRSTYLRQSVKEKDDDLIQRHEEYYHFAKLIKICVVMFGKAEFQKLFSKYLSSNDQQDQQSLFHVVYSIRGHCPWLRVKWNYPISTVSNLELLKKPNDGFLLELHKDDGVYFDCRFISKFYFKKEGLFMDCNNKGSSFHFMDDKKQEIVTEPLPIRNIGNIDDEDAKKYILFIHAFIEIINTERIEKSFGFRWNSLEKQWIGRPSKWDKHEVQKYEDNMKNLIENKFTYFQNSGPYGVPSEYAKNCIDRFFKEKKEYGIDNGLFMSEHAFLSHLFLCNDGKGINFEFISYLFPNCNRITVYDTHRLRVINRSYMEWLFNALKNINKYNTENSEFRKKEHGVLIDGFIRIQSEINHVLIPQQINELILSFYPNISCKINTIFFPDCIDEKTEKLIESLNDLVPNGWKLKVKRTTIRIVIGGSGDDKGPSSLYVTRSSYYGWM